MLVLILKPINSSKVSYTVIYCLLVCLIYIKMPLIYELTGISVAQNLYIINYAVK